MLTKLIDFILCEKLIIFIRSSEIEGQIIPGFLIKYIAIDLKCGAMNLAKAWVEPPRSPSEQAIYQDKTGILSEIESEF